MKRSMFFILFVFTQIVFVVLIITKKNRFIELSYQKQKKERFKQELEGKKLALVQEKSLLTRHANVQAFAQKVLHMETVRLTQIKKLQKSHAATTEN